MSSRRQGDDGPGEVGLPTAEQQTHQVDGRQRQGAPGHQVPEAIDAAKHRIIQDSDLHLHDVVIDTLDIDLAGDFHILFQATQILGGWGVHGISKEAVKPAHQELQP